MIPGANCACRIGEKRLQLRRLPVDLADGASTAFVFGEEADLSVIALQKCSSPVGVRNVHEKAACAVKQAQTI